jgi:hypothetical protein
MTLKALLQHLETAGVREKFDGYLRVQIDLTKKKYQQMIEKAGPHADLDLLRVRVRDTLDEEETPQEVAKLVHRTFDTSSRRGKWYRLDVFQKKFPTKTFDPTKLSTRTDRAGTKAQWLKVYNDEEGVEDFSEGSEEAVDHTVTLDAGDSVLDENQVQEAAQDAKQAKLASGSKDSYQFTMADLGVVLAPSAAPSSSSSPAGKGSLKRNASDPPASSDDDNQAPTTARQLSTGSSRSLRHFSEHPTGGQQLPGPDRIDSAGLCCWGPFVPTLYVKTQQTVC